ncbi:DUF2850 domain-containing protein [Motilimonas eburnea]|uniref:DUF2850 domain-containing protein n=1 Tax=Motilimonas eburnea TaxID=1737488 RepID=UPI001E4DBD96|nr:DUF2850 domain-containing protein [Motilimonas eburnea]MCE2570129.1 DUF2850 domain-containing protein [Motilimonas eburnea]
MLKTILICIISLAVILLGSAAFVAYYDFSGEPQVVDTQIYGKWRSEGKPYGDYEYFEFTPEGYQFESRFHPASYEIDGKMVTISKRGETLTFKVINDSLIEREVPRLKRIRYTRVE